MHNGKKIWLHIIVLMLSVALLLCSVVVSFSWMTDGGNLPSQRLWSLLYGKDSTKGDTIGVQNVELTFNFYQRNKDNIYEPLVINNPDDDSLVSPLIEVDAMMPSNAIYFMIELFNNTDANAIVDISFAGITSSSLDTENKFKMSDVLYLSLSRTEGYKDVDGRENFAPTTTYERVSDIITYTEDENKKTIGAMPFAKNLVIPPTPNGTSPIRVYGYLLFDRNANTEYETCDFNIDRIFIIG